MLLQINLQSPYSSSYIRYYSGNPFMRLPIAGELVMIGEMRFMSTDRAMTVHRLERAHEQLPHTTIYLSFVDSLERPLTDKSPEGRRYHQEQRRAGEQEFAEQLASLGFYLNGGAELEAAKRAFFASYSGE